jgi:hypothetical protein
MAETPEVLAATSRADKAIAALLFIAASTNAMDVYSALNSSPWTAESFGGDPGKARSCREYVWLSIGITSVYGLAATVIARSAWPIAGTILADAFMFWVYERALNRAEAKGSTSW